MIQSKLINNLETLLFPQKLATLINNFPQEKQQFICEIGRSALSALIERRLKCFDALVGENACQIRASKIVLIDRNVSQSSDEQKRIVRLVEHMEVVSTHATDELTDDDRYVILSYLLTLTRDRENYMRTNPDNLTELFPIMKEPSDPILKDLKLLDKLVYEAKIQLAQRSIDHLQKESKQLSCSEEIKKLLGYMVDRGINKPSTRIFESPCYYNIQIVMESVRSRQMVLILKIHLTAQNTFLKLAFRASPSPQGFLFGCLEQPANHVEEGAFIIEGSSTDEDPPDAYLRKLFPVLNRKSLHDRLIEIILVNASSHKQYVKAETVNPVLNKSVCGAIETSPFGNTQATVQSVFNKARQLIEKEPHLDSATALKRLEKTYFGAENSNKLRKGLKACFGSDTLPIYLLSSYAEMRKREENAESLGLCERNPSLFAINHIYADRVANHLEIVCLPRDHDELLMTGDTP